MESIKPKEMTRQQTFKNLLVRQYLATGQIPWSPGYLVYRERFITETFQDSRLMSMFRYSQSLPSGYGYGLDERCVEYPWLVAQLDPKPEHVLDAGSALNFEFILDHPIWQHKQLHILTLAPEAHCYWNRGISYFFEDLRDIPIKEDYYDTVICISTLEHVGLDNRQFTGQHNFKEQKPQDFILAVREMHRVLKPCGQLLLTVPFGQYKNTGSQQVFDKKLLGQISTVFNPAISTRTFFVYTEDGWRTADIDQCKDCDYVDWIMLPKRSRPEKFPIQPDGAAAARAVACVKLEKFATEG